MFCWKQWFPDHIVQVVPSHLSVYQPERPKKSASAHFCTLSQLIEYSKFLARLFDWFELKPSSSRTVCLFPATVERIGGLPKKDGFYLISFDFGDLLHALALFTPWVPCRLNITWDTPNFSRLNITEAGVQSSTWSMFTAWSMMFFRQTGFSTQHGSPGNH